MEPGGARTQCWSSLLMQCADLSCQNDYKTQLHAYLYVSKNTKTLPIAAADAATAIGKAGTPDKLSIPEHT